MSNLNNWIQILKLYLATLYSYTMMDLLMLYLAYRKQQKFRGWKVLWFAGFIRYAGKSFAIFPSLLIECFNKSFAFPTWILLKTVISILGNGREYIKYDWSIYRHVCADFMLSRMTMQSQEEKSYCWSEFKMKQITNHFLVSFFCKLLPNLSAETL